MKARYVQVEKAGTSLKPIMLDVPRTKGRRSESAGRSVWSLS